MAVHAPRRRPAPRTAPVNLRRRAVAGAALAVCLGAHAASAVARLPQRVLTVEVRLVDEADPDAAGGAGGPAQTPAAAGFTVRTNRPAAGPAQGRSVSVLNGTRATLRLAQSLPFEWVQAAQAPPATAAASGPAGGAAGAVVNAVTWLHAGLALSVLPRWPGADAPVTVDIDFELAQVDDRSGSELPASSTDRATTTVVAPLGRWTTFAAEGAGPDPVARLDRSAATDRAPRRRRFQVRVLAP